MSADISQYLDLIPSENQGQPDYFEVLTAILQPFADNVISLDGLPELFDLDTAVGSQLDVDGQWIGVSRQLLEPIQGLYFTWGTAGLGWDQGIWRGTFDPLDGLVSLSDPNYRILLFATVLANHWNGSIPGLYDILDTLFLDAGGFILNDEGYPIPNGLGGFLLNTAGPTWLIQDNGDMSFDLVMLSPNIPPIIQAFITGGYLHIKPNGVRMTVMEPSVPGTPVFGFGVEYEGISGWGVGSWPEILAVS